MTKRGPDKLMDDLSAYLDGELSAQRAAEVRRLLDESHDARRRLEELRAVSDKLGDLPRMRAPDELTAAMTRHAERRLLLDEHTRNRRPRVLRLFVKSCAAAAVLAACVFVGYRTVQPAANESPERPASLSRPESETGPVVPMSIAAREQPPTHGGGRSTDADDLVVVAAPETATEMAEDTIQRGQVIRKGAQPVDRLAQTEDRHAEPEQAPRLTAVPTMPEPVPRTGTVMAGIEEPTVPMVSMRIRTSTADEYAANVGVLAEWNDGHRSEPAQTLARKWAYSADLPAAELVRRVAALSAVNSHDRLWVETDLGAADADLMVAVAQALSDGPGSPDEAAEGVFAQHGAGPVPTEQPAGERLALLSLPRPLVEEATRAPHKPTRRAKAEPAAAGRAGGGAAGKREPPWSLPARSGGGMAGGRGRAGSEFGKTRRQMEQEATRESVRRRHAEVTSQPQLEVVFVEPPATQPASSPSIGAPASAPTGSPTSTPSPAIIRRDGPDLLDRLIRLLFGELVGVEADVSTDIENATDSPPPTETSRVRLRVMILPPPAATAPTSTPSPTAGAD